jgi:DNA-directed RNA polymerase specialized sigma24 family protein
MMRSRRDIVAGREHRAEQERREDVSATALMLGYCRGEHEAFEQLYATVAPPLFAQLIAWTGDQQQAGIFLHRTFKALHEARSLYVEGADPIPWIVQMAQRELRLESRRRNQQGRRPFWFRLRSVWRNATQLKLGLGPEGDDVCDRAEATVLARSTG